MKNKSTKERKQNHISPRQLGILVIYNVVLAILFCIGLIILVANEFVSALVTTLISVLIAGGCGGTLCNLRGLFKHIDRNKGRFPFSLMIPFYIRPLTGAITGLFTFFVGNLLLTSLSIDATSGSWGEGLSGRLPYITVAILAGFGAQEFMERLKEVAKTLFSERAEELYGELERLSNLYRDGVLTDDEYTAAKEKLLGITSSSAR